ncbi:MAG: 4-alpha-glucanotransferase, partial [Acidimicrobiales bacterium]
TIRANLRHARGLRIDHVMGLFRLFWIPDGRTGADGAYVRFAGRELLDVVALESHRAGGLLVGEDLGTVEEGVRDRLAEAGLLSTRLLWFEDEPPAQWPAQAMAAVTTHDLATIAGTWTGTDRADERAAGIAVDDIHDTEMRDRLRQVAVVTEDATAADVTVAVHRALAGAPSMIVTATLDDLLGAEHRPNLPGTIDQHPNWRIPLPVPLDDLAGHPVAEAVAAALGAGRAP